LNRPWNKPTLCTLAGTSLLAGLQDAYDFGDNGWTHRGGDDLDDRRF
jgi:hypothetical protein